MGRRNGGWKSPGADVGRDTSSRYEWTGVGGGTRVVCGRRVYWEELSRIGTGEGEEEIENGTREEIPRRMSVEKREELTEAGGKGGKIRKW
jgi:hypothetical protein